MTNSTEVMIVTFKKSLGIKSYLILSEVFEIFKVEFLCIFVKENTKKCFKTKKKFGNKFEFSTMDSTKIIVLTPKKSLDEKSQLNIIKSIEISSRIF